MFGNIIVNVSMASLIPSQSICLCYVLPSHEVDVQRRLIPSNTGHPAPKHPKLGCMTATSGLVVRKRKLMHSSQEMYQEDEGQEGRET